MARAAELGRRGDREAAIGLYEQAVQARPAASEPLRRIAYVYLGLGDGARARAYAERALQRDPSDGEALIVLGAARSAAGDRAGALAAYRRCAALTDSPQASRCAQLAR
jgi:tetratricopeptide (TPR) repeat protein